jgi:hypothetical protein
MIPPFAVIHNVLLFTNASVVELMLEKFSQPAAKDLLTISRDNTAIGKKLLFVFIFFEFYDCKGSLHLQYNTICLSFYIKSLNHKIDFLV